MTRPNDAKHTSLTPNSQSKKNQSAPSFAVSITMQKSDIFRIYVVTDTHLGFKERDPIRQRDTLYTFRESLLLSNALKADFIVHSGDLFDVQRPSQQCLMQAMTLMKEYLIGKDPIRFQVLQRQTRTLNFESEDINVKMPIFIIHGNHGEVTV
eukprot:Gregarina_sp_Poly_1__2821@NODE_1787_length_3328_cov_67_604416_g1164_i0_p3_GENE_NODE_1787_length_3328_cov_67_604416_g1164_i0NODE_1787_length_3328_cov_67_604416_g1164_i0_p3_ORF_typecomplete_len153_score8_91Metallophos/PF00149_28/2_1e10Metallophos_2/PF12850_7/0_0013_NODE_1787_length_3328_cov_67_604416_g1164_i013891847